MNMFKIRNTTIFFFAKKEEMRKVHHQNGSDCTMAISSQAIGIQIKKTDQIQI